MCCLTQVPVRNPVTQPDLNTSRRFKQAWTDVQT